MKLLIAIMLIIGMAGASPLDLLSWRNASPEAVSLSGLDPASALAIDATNPELTVFKDRDFPDLGRLFSGNRELTNGMAGVPAHLINFSKELGEIPPSVDTNPANNGDEGGIVYL